MINHKTQTGSEIGFYKTGDPHPVIKDRFFRGYNHTLAKGRSSAETWASGRALANYRARYEPTEEELKERAHRKAGQKERRRIRNKLYQQKNKAELREKRDKGKANAQGRKYRHARDQGTLSDAQYEEIEGIYLQAERMNQIFGERVFEVDHTVPLSLGGRHLPNNLQVVPTKWNRIKGNRNSERWEAPLNEQQTNYEDMEN